MATRDDNPMDWWTLSHAGVGAALGIVNAPIGVALGAAILWEFVENIYIIPVYGWREESAANAIADVAANMVGYTVARGVRAGIKATA